MYPLYSVGLSKKEVMSQCFMFFLAGFDTVASTVYLTLYYLALHPEYQQRAREEVDDVIGDKVTINYMNQLNTLKP